mgnify:CR=1 FL=1
MRLLMHKLMADEPVAVHFNSFEEAKIFYEEMKRNYPEKVRGWSHVIYAKRDEERGGVCYCPYFNSEYGSMTHASRYTYEEYGTRIVEFYELLSDESEIAESEIPVVFLLN